MSTHLLMLKGVRTAAGRRIYDCPDFEEDESKCKEKCRKAGVKYEGPRENEDYLLGSVDREEKKMAHKFTDIRRDKLNHRCKRRNEQMESFMDKGRNVTVCKPCDNDPNKQQQHVCAVCDTVRIGSKELTSMSEEELLSKETRIGLGAFQEDYGIELHPDLLRQYERDGRVAPFKASQKARRRIRGGL